MRSSLLPSSIGIFSIASRIKMAWLTGPTRSHNAARIKTASAMCASMCQTPSFLNRSISKPERTSYGDNQPFGNPDSSNLAESGKLPSYAMFATDRARVVGGANLAQLQLDLANEFVQRPEFLARYPANLTGSQFVSAVLQTIKSADGVDLGPQTDALNMLFSS